MPGNAHCERSWAPSHAPTGVRVRARGCELLSSLHDARAAVQPEQRLGPVRTAATASPTIDPDTALTSKNGQSGPSAQSDAQDGDTSVVVIVALEESADSEATLASINEAVAASFPAVSCRSEAGGGVLFPLGEIRD